MGNDKKEKDDNMKSKFDRVCYFCNKKFSSPSHLKGHMTIHTNETPFFCRVCGTGFKFKQSLQRHQLKSHMSQSAIEKLKSTRNLCKLCNKSFDSKYKLNIHISRHTKEKAFSCEICKKQFNLEGYLTKHKKMVHQKLRPYSCPQCGKSFGAAHTLSRHLNTHEFRGQDFECAKCPKKFTNKIYLNRHVQNFHYKGGADKKAGWKFNCYFCKKKLQSFLQLEIHMRVHTREAPFSCDTCLKYFSQKNSLKGHQRTHLSQDEKAKMKLEYKFVCKICQKRFRTIAELRYHIFSHTKERPFYCEICKKGFTILAGLKIHKKTVHQKLRTFKCAECGKSFGQKTILQRHSVVHSGARNFNCSQCPKKYTQRGHLNIHVRIEHLGEVHQCPKCSINFRCKKAFKKHIDKNHS